MGVDLDGFGYADRILVYDTRLYLYTFCLYAFLCFSVAPQPPLPPQPEPPIPMLKPNELSDPLPGGRVAPIL